MASAPYSIHGGQPDRKTLSDGIDGGVTVVYHSPRTLCNVKLPKHPLIFRGSLAEELSIGWKPLLQHSPASERARCQLRPQHALHIKYNF
jgi:hypothetical protein